jgi:cyclic pyranopterin phosphate synthase
MPRTVGSGSEATDLTHIDQQGHARMVDVTAKPLTRRVAVAKCLVVTSADVSMVLAQSPDGLDIIETARIAGVQGAKQTSALIPLCHSIRIDRVTVDLEVQAHGIEVCATTEIIERTGVEMEALTACALAAVSLVKAFSHADPSASIEDLTLWHKSGGRSGTWQRGGQGDGLHQEETRGTESTPPSVAD